MVNVDVNLASLIVQRNLSKSTNRLTTAMERLSTGFKINHAHDNAAGYAVGGSLASQLSSLDMAGTNVMMGVDMVDTASDTIQLLIGQAERLRDLCLQGRNGTYGETDLKAINLEAATILDQIAMTYKNAEYNDVPLFQQLAYTVDTWLPQAEEGKFIIEDGTKIGPIQTVGATGQVGPTGTPGLVEDITPQSQYNGFIQNPVDYTDAQIEAMDSISDIIDAGGTFEPGHEYAIKTLDDYAKLHEYLGSNTGDDITFVLGIDVDLSSEALADSAKTPFEGIMGTFNGNGHTISNFTYSNTTDDVPAGLFRNVADGGVVKNVNLENCNVTGLNQVGGLVGLLYSNSYVENCHVTGSVNGDSYVGGLVGNAKSNSYILDSYAECDVQGARYEIGGLVGEAGGRVTISNSFATGTVVGLAQAGGLVGLLIGESTIENCYASTEVTALGGLGKDAFGGLVGQCADGSSIRNSYAKGSVTAGRVLGGLCGIVHGPQIAIDNCFADVSVSGYQGLGGFIGLSDAEININNCISLGAVNGRDSGIDSSDYYNQRIGGFIGRIENSGPAIITNSSSKSDVTIANTRDVSAIGGFIGSAFNNKGEITACSAEGNVKVPVNYDYMHSLIGGFIGLSEEGTITNSIAKGFVDAGDYSNYIGGFAGVYAGGTIRQSAASGNVIGGYEVGGFVGHSELDIYRCCALGDVTAHEMVGGLVGYSVQSIGECYATGNVFNNSGRGTGGLVGYGKYVHNSYATGNVSGIDMVGGLVGYLDYEGSVDASYATGNVSASWVVGGLVGHASYSANINNCYAEGNVELANIWGEQEANEAGGLVGSMKPECTINNCYATGDVEISQANRIGGLLGYAQGTTIEGSYAEGSVSGSDMVGGIVGYFVPYGTEYPAQMTECWAGGNITGKTDVGGIIGYAGAGEDSSESGTVAITDCVSYAQVSGQDRVGSFMGAAVYEDTIYYHHSSSTDTYTTSAIGVLTSTEGKGCKAAEIEGLELISGMYAREHHYYESTDSYTDTYSRSDVPEEELEKIATFNRLSDETNDKADKTVNIQLGNRSGDAHRITFNTSFTYDLSDILKYGVESDEGLAAIDDFLANATSKVTELGSVANRLESAYSGIESKTINLTASHSTIMDVDLAAASSEYLQQQIIQQANATLLSAANQIPATALQLIGASV